VARDQFAAQHAAVEAKNNEGKTTRIPAPNQPINELKHVTIQLVQLIPGREKC
jgi:hypothetical protein